MLGVWGGEGCYFISQCPISDRRRREADKASIFKLARARGQAFSDTKRRVSFDECAASEPFYGRFGAGIGSD